MSEKDPIVKLIDYIVTNEIKTNEKLPSIKQFSALWETTESQVRSALIQANALGIIDMHSRAGTFIKEFDYHRMEELFSLYFRIGIKQANPGILALYELKTAIDTESFVFAAVNVTPNDLFELKEIINHQEKAMGDSRQFVQYDELFHHTVARISGNTLFVIILDVIHAMLRSDRYRNIIELERFQRILQEHNELYAALLRRDVQNLARLAREHSSRRKKQMLETNAL
jgi:DNA-binding FadR family transcriptional regulator